MPRKATMTPKQRLQKIYDYNNEYVRRTYDRFSINLPKGYKDTITDHAAALGLSVTEYIKRLIDADIAGNAPQLEPGTDSEPDSNTNNNPV